MSFNDLTRKFLMGEWKQNVSVLSRARTIKEALESLKPRTIKERQRIHWLGGGKGKERSKFFTGFAEAMAEQWG